MTRVTATIKAFILSGLAGTLVLVLATVLMDAPVISFIVIVWPVAFVLALLFLLASLFTGSRAGLIAVALALGAVLAAVVISQVLARGAELNILFALDLALAVQLPINIAEFGRVFEPADST